MYYFLTLGNRTVNFTTLLNYLFTHIKAIASELLLTTNVLPNVISIMLSSPEKVRSPSGGLVYNKYVVVKRIRDHILTAIQV